MASSMEELSFSLHFDKKLFRHDIAGSRAHAKGLRQAGILTAAELQQMDQGLAGILADLEAGKDLYEPTDEDIHMAVERILTARIGPLGKKLHTGRSRNDQVATDLKLYVREEAARLITFITTLQESLLRKAEGHPDLILPGYTHVQQAQPILASHYLLSFFFALERDKGRLRHLREETCAEMPLGSGALAGSAFPYERALVAKELGFPRFSQNSIDATSHRDFALEFLAATAILGTLLSRHAEDFVLWSSREFSFIRLGEAYTSGSSIMPQKKNPDSMELLRGKSGRLLGDFTRLFTVLKGLPLCYGRDLQEDKEPVFDAAETASLCLRVMREAVDSLEFRPQEIAARLDPALLATDLADYLAEKGIPFRDAHHIVGSLVKRAEAEGCSFLELSEKAWKDVPDGEAFRRRLDFRFSVERRNIAGGTGSKSVKNQLKAARGLLNKGRRPSPLKLPPR